MQHICPNGFEMKQTTIKIKDRKWKVKVLSDKVFDQNFGEHRVAVTAYNADKGYIYFKKSHLDRGTIIHELVHAYLSDMNLDGSMDDVEERFCDLIANHLYEIERNYRIIFSNFI